MTEASTLKALARHDEGPLWGIGSYFFDGIRRDVPVSFADIERDTAFARRVLSGFGVGRGDIVIILARGGEGTWVMPFHFATTELGATYSMAWNRRFEVPRVTKLVRGLSPKLVLGLSLDLGEALDAAPGGIEELFKPVEHVGVRREATNVVEKAGLEPLVFDLLGPTVAIECSHRRGAHVDPDQWALTERGGMIEISTVGARAHQVANEAVAPGSLDHGPCPCGLPGPRALIDSSTTRSNEEKSK